MSLLHRALITLALTTPLCAAAQQLPAGTHLPTDDASANDPMAEQRTKAEAALAKQDFAAAEPALHAILAKNPKDARALYDLGYLKENTNDDIAAEAAYRNSTEADPHSFEPHLSLGLLLARKGDTTSARKELQTAIEVPTQTTDPSLRARAYRALAQIDAGDRPDDARNELVEALKISPETQDDTLLAAELAEKSDDNDAASTAYRRAFDRDPNDLQALDRFTRFLARHGRATEAEALLQAAVEKHPDNLPLAAQLASLYGANGRGEEALPLIERLHAANPANNDLTRMLARLYVQQSQPEKANPLYTSLLQGTPTDATLLDDWGDALIRQKRFADAEPVLQRAFAARNTLPSKEAAGNIASHLAFAASANHDPETVLQAITFRDSVMTTSPSSLFLAATAHDSLHHTKQAADFYRQFLALANGKFPDQEWEARHRLIALDHAK